MDEIRAGVIGLGGFFKGVHLACMRRAGGLRIAAACDLDEARRAEAGDLIGGGVALYANLGDMLSSGGLDAVYIITRPAAMPGIVAEVASAGLPVFCEKPPGRTSEDTLRMADACRSAGVVNQVAFNRRFGPLAAKLDEWLAQAAPASRIEVSFRRVYSPSPTEVTGSGIHALDKMVSIMGSVRRVMGARSAPRAGAPNRDASRLGTPGQGWCHFHAAFEFVNGAAGSFQFDNREPTPLEQYRISCVSADTLTVDQFVLDFPPPNRQRGASSVSRRRLAFRGWKPETGTILDIQEDRFALPDGEDGPPLRHPAGTGANSPRFDRRSSRGPDDLLISGGYQAEHDAFAAAVREGRSPASASCRNGGQFAPVRPKAEPGAAPTFADTVHSMQVAEAVQAAQYREFGV